MEKFAAGENTALRERAQAARQAFEEALDNNFNTAEALAPIFDLVRDGNVAMDQGEFRDGNRPVFLDTLERWDRIFAVLEDTDQAKLRELGLAKAATAEVSGQPLQLDAETSAAMAPNGHADPLLVELLSDAEIEKRISERNTARRRGEFSRADQIRQQLTEAGVILEDTKAGTRWKRK
jgi:cysteinyl-tRNA synthetase